MQIYRETQTLIHTFRIKDILRSSTNHSVEDMMKYQGDTFSTLADITIPLLEPFLPNLGRLLSRFNEANFWIQNLVFYPDQLQNVELLRL